MYESNTTCEAFVLKKIVSKSIDTPVCYGKHHETIAITFYVDYQTKEGIAVYRIASNYSWSCINTWSRLVAGENSITDT